MSVTSVSPTPIRGTMALQTYWPASAWLTDFRYSWLLLLSTCSIVRDEHRDREMRSDSAQYISLMKHVDLLSRLH